jgi:hypothetical protein
MTALRKLLKWLFRGLADLYIFPPADRRRRIGVPSLDPLFLSKANSLAMNLWRDGPPVCTVSDDGCFVAWVRGN